MGMTVTIWHNPRCSKSREALSLLRDQGIEPEIRLYLKDAPDEGEIREALAKLGLSAINLARQGETRFRELGLDDETEEDMLVAAMAMHPILIERPVVFNGEKAVVGRPPINVLDLV
jgi:arsenate reductase (glutaredoxin)